MMSFDVWLDLERSNSPDTDSSTRFKYYSMGASCALVFFIFMFVERLMGGYGSFLNVVLFVNGVFMIMAGLKIHKLSKDSEINQTLSFKNNGRRWDIR